MDEKLLTYLENQEVTATTPNNQIDSTSYRIIKKAGQEYLEIHSIKRLPIVLTNEDKPISNNYSFKDKVKSIDSKLVEETCRFIERRDDIALEKNSNSENPIEKPNTYTEHGKQHYEAVDRIIDELIQKSRILLNDTEKIILFLAVWFHDIGMYEDIYKEIAQEFFTEEERKDVKTIREKHELTTAIYIQKEGAKKDTDIGAIFNLERLKRLNINNLINTVCNIIKFHRRKYSIKQLSENRYFGEKVRADLLAALLRMADTLSIDSDRFDIEKYEAQRVTGGFDRIAMFHWIKSYVISAIYLDYNEQIIRVVMDLPLIKGNIAMTENAEKLRLKIHKEIEDDLIEVSEIFFRHKIDFYRAVKVEYDYVTGMDKNMENDIRSVILDLDILMSPNSSMAIEKALESIKNIAQSENRDVKEDLDKFLRYLNDDCNKGICKTGITNIIKIINDVRYDPTDIITKIEEIKIKRNDARRVINQQAVKHLEGINHIFLFGYSQMVIDLLSYYYNILCFDNKKDLFKNLNIYVFECAVKTRYSSSNNIDYHDGLNYSNALMQNIFSNRNEFVGKIKILPDSAFATLLAELIIKDNIDEKRCLFLLGANGVFIDRREADVVSSSEGIIEQIVIKNNGQWGKIVHTTGHRSMTVIANSFNIPIRVVVDSIKFNTQELNSSSPMDINTNNCWIPLQAEEFEGYKSSGIDLMNYEQDDVPLIDDDIILISDVEIRYPKK